MTVNARLLGTALIVAAAAVSACGKRGDPLPPIRPVPGRIADLIARRTDDRVELRFTVPAANVDGTTPSAIDRIEIYRMMTTEDAKSPSTVVLTNRKNVIGQIVVRRPPPPDTSASKDKPAAAAPEKTPAPPKPEPPAGPAPGEPAVFADTTPYDGAPANAVRYYMVIEWAGGQQQRSSPLVVRMVSTAPPRPVENLAGSFDETSIKITWVGPPLLFLPIARPGSPLPSSIMPLPVHPAPNELPIALMPKAPPAPAGGTTKGAATVTSGAAGAPATTGAPATATPPPATPPPPSVVPPIGQPTTSRTTTTAGGAQGTKGTTTTKGTTGATGFPALGQPPVSTTPPLGAAAPGMPAIGPAIAGTGAVGAPSVSVGVSRAYRVTEVDESGRELAAGGPLAPTIAASSLTLPVAFDKTRCFVVRTVDTMQQVVLESTPSAPVCVTPKDTFPPAAPTELRAFSSEAGRVVLTWTGVEAADLAGYVVLRGEGAGDNMQPLNATPMAETTFTDTTAKSGVTYVYAVVSVDSSPQHNPSAQSNKQTIVAR